MDPQRTIEFDGASKTYIIRDKQALVRDVLHTQRPVSINAATALDAAECYLKAQAQLLGLNASELGNLRRRPGSDLSDTGVEYCLLSEKRQFDMTTVTFQQTSQGLPVWGAGISVHLKHRSHSFHVVCAQASRGDIHAPPMPSEDRVTQVTPVDAATLARQLGISDTTPRFDASSMRISHQNVMTYCYHANERTRISGLVGSDALDTYGLSLRPVPDDIVDGSYRLVSAVYFDLSRQDGSATHWVAFVDARSHAVLYLQEFAACANGKVFLADPMTTHGGPLPTSEATNAILNPLRVWQAIPNLADMDPQGLTGRNVQIVNIDGPMRLSPTRPKGVDFVFDARTDDFSAVNAYYNCDRFFSLVESLGFKRDDYFSWTTFPIPVDHRGAPVQGGGVTGFGAEIRGQPHPGSPGMMGIMNVVFALAQPDALPPLGNANDWRVVLHELGGHGTLLNHVASTHFRFAHSAGDSLAAILNDPESNAPDKGETFPWLPMYERWHNRKVENGWAWDGPHDNPSINDQLHQEQILSTTHFRLYQAIGGGNPDRIDDRRFAARYTAFLILRAIQTLTPPTNPRHASDWLANLIVADAGNWTSAGQSGGAYEKVIYWAFEKQNLFGGNPPPIDVFIDDGRGGEYTFQPDSSHCPAIWNRHAYDGNEEHEAPIPNVVNYAYVKIKNRGSRAATSVIVNAFQNHSQASFDYPDDWRPMQISELSAPDVAVGSPGVVVGPFHWIPAASGNRILMAVSADGDASNIHKFGPGCSISASRLVPNDNNLGMRKV